MSFRAGGGRGRGGRSGGGRGGDRGGGRGGRGGGGGRFQRDEGPPSEIVEAGHVEHDCEGELLCRWEIADKVPYFNAGIYLQNKQKIGKVDEILGKINEIFFTIKLEAGVQSKSFQPKDLVFIGTDKLLPLSRFTSPGAPGGGRGAGGRGGPGARGPGRGRGPPGGRGGGRGVFAGRGGRGGGRSPVGRGGFGRGRGGRH